MKLPKEYYKFKCGCVKYTNANTPTVRGRIELPGTWDVWHCDKHQHYGFSGFEQSLNRQYLEYLEEQKDG